MTRSDWSLSERVEERLGLLHVVAHVADGSLHLLLEGGRVVPITGEPRHLQHGVQQAFSRVVAAHTKLAIISENF